MHARDLSKVCESESEMAAQAHSAELIEMGSTQFVFARAQFGNLAADRRGNSFWAGGHAMYRRVAKSMITG